MTSDGPIEFSDVDVVKLREYALQGGLIFAAATRIVIE